jgi:ankyrin repeat protein/WD40 repeat protein
VRSDDEGRRQRLAFIDELASIAENRPPPALDAAMNRNPDLAQQFDFDAQDCRIVISLREEYLAHLDSLAGQIPSISDNGFRLSRLSRSQALAVVAEAGAAVVDPGTAQRIVDFVAGETDESQDRTGGTSDGDRRASGNHVSPALLSLVCYELNEARKSLHQDRITPTQVDQQKRGILEDFYDRCLEGLAPAQRPATWWLLEEKLLTPDEHRNFVSKATALEELENQGLPRKAAFEALEHLRNQYLVQFDERDGRIQIELTHDILTRVVARRRLERRQHRAEQHRDELARDLRRTRVWAAIFAAVTFLAIVASIVAVCLSRVAGTERKRAEHAHTRAERALADLHCREGQAAAEREDWAGALRSHLASLKAQSSHAGARLGAVDALANFVPEVAQLDAGQPITAFASSADGRWLALATVDRSIELWSTATWSIATNFGRHTEAITCLAFAPDGTWLMSGSCDGAIRTWPTQSELDSGFKGATTNHPPQMTMTDHSISLTSPVAGVRSVTISPNGVRAVSCGTSGSIALWQVPRLELIGYYDSSPREGIPGERIVATTFRPDNQTLGSVSANWRIRLWSWSSTAVGSTRGLISAAARTQNYPARTRAPSPRAARSSAGTDSTEKSVFPVLGPSVTPGPLPFGFGQASNTEIDLKPIDRNGTPNSVFFTEDGKFVVVGSDAGEVVLWDNERKEQHSYFNAPLRIGTPVRCLFPLAHGRSVSVSINDVLISVLNPSLPLARLRVFDKDVAFAQASPDGRFLYTANVDGLVHIWRLAQYGRFLTLLKEPAPPAQSAPSESSSIITGLASDGSLAMYVDQHGRATIWSASEGVRHLKLESANPHCALTALAMEKQGRTLVEGWSDGTVQETSFVSGARRLIGRHGGGTAVSALAQSPVAAFVVSGHTNGDLLIWDAAGRNGVPLSTARAERVGPRGITCLAFSCDGRWLAEGRDRIVILWDMLSRSRIALLRGHDEDVEDLAFSPDGSILASVSGGSDVRIWGVERPGQNSRCGGPEEGVSRVTFSPDGRLVIGSCGDGSVRFWDSKSTLLLATFNLRTTNRVSKLGLAGAGSEARSLALVLAWQNGIPPLLLPLNGDEQSLPEQIARTLDLFCPWDFAESGASLRSESPWSFARRRLEGLPARGSSGIPSFDDSGTLFRPLHVQAGDRTARLEQARTIYEAVKRGDTNAINDLVKRGVQVNADCPFNTTPLTLACEKGYIDVVAFLVQSGALLDSPNRNGLTALEIALAQRNQPILRFLLAKGADRGALLRRAIRRGDTSDLALLLEDGQGVNSSDERGWTPLMAAAARDDARLTRFLMARGAAIGATNHWGQTPLAIASVNCSVTAARLLLEGGAPVEAPDVKGWTPLMYAVRATNAAGVSLLLDYRAAVDARSADGWTPLMNAAWLNMVEAAQLLVARHADVNATNQFGKTALIIAVANGAEATARFLLDEGARIEATDANGWTPLMYAVRVTNHSIVNLLLRRGAAVEARCKNGWTPLMFAARFNQEENVRLLLDHGAMVDATNTDGATALVVAAGHDSEAAVRLLLDGGARIEARDVDGQTPLFSAAATTNVALIRLLLDRGAWRTSHAAFGASPAWNAAAEGRFDAVRLLLGDAGYDLAERLATNRMLTTLILTNAWSMIEPLVCGGGLAESQGRPWRAEMIYTSALNAMPTAERASSPWALLCCYRLSELTFESTNAGPAAEWTERALELCPATRDSTPERRRERAGLLSNLGWHLELAGAFLRALPKLEEGAGLDSDPGPTPLQMNLAHAYLFTGRFADARAIYLKFRGNDLGDGRRWEKEVLSDLDVLQRQLADVPPKVSRFIDDLKKDLEPTPDPQ